MASKEKQYEDKLVQSCTGVPPSFVLKVLLAIGKFLTALLNKLTPPGVRATQQAGAFIVSSWLMMMAHLGVPDLLKDGPKTAGELSIELGGLREDDLYRALRMLVCHGYFDALPGADGKPTRFRNNDASAVLREDHPGTVRHILDHWHVHAYRSYDRDVMKWHLQQKGGDEVVGAFDKVHGTDIWTYNNARPDLMVLFSKAMDDVNNIGEHALVSDYHFGDFKRMIDIGGANGSMLSAVLKQYPNLQGVLFDQPSVIANAAKVWESTPDLAALRKRTSLVGGDFFKPETIPVGQDGDVMFLRSILHDCAVVHFGHQVALNMVAGSDERSLSILKSLRKAIGSANVTVAIAEMTLNPEFSQGPLDIIRYKIDMLMHIFGGKERVMEQWKKLFADSGFQVKAIHQTRSPVIIIDAMPI